MIQIIPAIDIIEGRCVRLSQGDYNRRTSYDPSPLDMALKFRDTGLKRIHLVDLEGAKAGTPRNLRTLEQIASATGLEIEWGGGVKKDSDLRDVLDAGARDVIVGSVAVRNPELFDRWLRTFGGDRIILGADLRNGKVAVAGWTEDSSASIHELIELFLPAGLSQVITTDISKDGMLEGPSTQLYVDLAKLYPSVSFTVSGGVSSIRDILRLNRLGLKRVIVGKAIYENRISMADIARCLGNDL